MSNPDDSLRNLALRLVSAGYQAGHNDTVEGTFSDDPNETDSEYIHGERVDDIFEGYTHKYMELNVDLRLIGALIKRADGGTFANDPPDAIIETVRRILIARNMEIEARQYGD